MTVKGPYGYTRGWNAKTGPYDCPDDAYVDAQNMELLNGRISACNGNLRWTTGNHPGGATQLGWVSYFAGVLVCYAGNKIATASASSIGAWTDITGAVTFTPTAGYDWAAALNGILVLGGPNTVPIQWTGTGNCTALGGSPPFGENCGTMVNNYLFMGNDVANPSRVWWSAIQDPNTWPGANFVDVRPEDSSNPITALFPFGEDLLIFKSNCIARFYTNQLSGTLGPLIVISEKLGGVGQRSVDRLPDGRIAFVGFNNHVYIYDGNTFDDISDAPTPRSNIQTVLNSLVFKTNGLAQGTLRVYQAKNQIWITYPFTWTNVFGSFSAGVIFRYDYVNGCWVSPTPDRRIYTAVNYTASTKEYLITAGNTYLYQEDTGNVNNDSVAAHTSFDSYVTKSIPLGVDSSSYTPRSIYLPINSGNLTASLLYGANGYSTPTTTATISISGSTLDRKKVVLLNTPSGKWDTGQFRFDAAISNQPFNLSPFFLSDEVESQT